MAAFGRSQTTSAIPTRNKSRRRASLQSDDDDDDDMDGSITNYLGKKLADFRTPEKGGRRVRMADDDDYSNSNDDEMDGSFTHFLGRKIHDIRGGLMDRSLGGRQRDDMDMSVPAFLPSHKRSDAGFKEFSPGLSTSKSAALATQDLLKSVSDHTRRRASTTTVPSHIRQRITRSESFGSSKSSGSDPSSSHDGEEDCAITEKNTAANATMSASSYRATISSRATMIFNKMRRNNSTEETIVAEATAPNTPPPPQVAMSRLMTPRVLDTYAVSQDPTELIAALAKRDAQIESLTQKLEQANRNGGGVEKEDPRMSQSTMSAFGRRPSKAEPFIPSGWEPPPPPPSEVMQEQLEVAQMEQESTQRLLLEREQQINSLQRGMQRTIADTEKYQKRIEKQNGQIASLKNKLKQANEKLQKAEAQNKINSVTASKTNNNSKQEEESTKASKVRFAQEKQQKDESAAKLEEMEKKLKERDQQFARQQAKMMLQSKQLEQLKKKASDAQREKEELQKELGRLSEMQEILDEEQDIAIPRTASA